MPHGMLATPHGADFSFSFLQHDATGGGSMYSALYLEGSQDVSCCRLGPLYRDHNQQGALSPFEVGHCDDCSLCHLHQQVMTDQLICCHDTPQWLLGALGRSAPYNKITYI